LLNSLVKTAVGPGHLELKEIPEPHPGPGQVLIDVAAAGICASDLHIRDWDIQLNLEPPVVIGHEFAGRIAEVGKDVTGVKVGQLVTSETAFSVCGQCIPCRSGEYNACAKKELIGYVHDGCFANHVVVPVERVHAVPAKVDLADAAMSEPLASVVRGVLELTEIRPGDLVVVAGPGTIGLLALQVARTAGARVLVLGARGDENRLRLAADLGADRVMNVVESDLVAGVREMGYPEGADVYLECSGSETAVRTGLELTRRRGQITQIGLPGQPLTLDFARIAYKELVIRGSLGQRWSAWRRALFLLESGQVNVRTLITHQLPLSEWEHAFEIFERREGLKIMLIPE
jgi:L-iditol 2-dehydrogenase